MVETKERLRVSEIIAGLQRSGYKRRFRGICEFFLTYVGLKNGSYEEMIDIFQREYPKNIEAFEDLLQRSGMFYEKRQHEGRQHFHHDNLDTPEGIQDREERMQEWVKKGHFPVPDGEGFSLHSESTNFYYSSFEEVPEKWTDFLGYPDCCAHHSNLDMDWFEDRLKERIKETGKDYSYLAFVSYIPHDPDCPETEKIGKMYQKFVEETCLPLAERVVGFWKFSSGIEE